LFFLLVISLPLVDWLGILDFPDWCDLPFLLGVMGLLGHCCFTSDNFIPHGGALPPSCSCCCFCRLCGRVCAAVPEKPGCSFVVEAIRMCSWFRSWCVLLMFSAS
jgi:hypothetical protein